MKGFSMRLFDKETLKGTRDTARVCVEGTNMQSNIIYLEASNDITYRK